MRLHNPFDMHVLGISALSMGLLFAAVPSSSNFTLKSYDIGNGGSSSSSSANYRLNGVAGSQSGVGSGQTSANFTVEPGSNNTADANVPPAPALTNPEGYYDRLKLVINTGNNPSDAKYLIAISNDNFVTTQYVQSDNSIGSSQTIGNYQTYTAWGGSGGFSVLGLTGSTSYRAKVKAIQGSFTGTAFGPATAAALTLQTSVSMSLATSLTSTPPFPVSFVNLTAGTVTNSNADAIIGLSSNAANGGGVYVRGTNGALLSASTSNSIVSVSADLSAAGSGYGAQVISASQTVGGPLLKQAPYSGSANNVGVISTALQPILMTSGPITSGQGTVRLMAKPATTTLSADDYADVVTLIIAMNF